MRIWTLGTMLAVGLTAAALPAFGQKDDKIADKDFVAKVASAGSRCTANSSPAGQQTEVANAQGSDVFDPEFKKVVSLVFKSSGRRKLPYSGVSTFLGAPYLPEAPDQADFGGLDVALIGIPMDLGVTNRAGARLVLDVGVNRGLTSTSTRWEFFTGFTYLLPKKLLPK